MGILKKKVNKIQEQVSQKQQEAKRKSMLSRRKLRFKDIVKKKRSHISKGPKRNRIEGIPSVPVNIRCSKNIVKNYGRMICTFSLSNMAAPYIKDFLNNSQTASQFNQTNFFQWISDHKRHLSNIEQLKALLPINENEDLETLTFKKLFQQLGRIFIKYFSVNWIFQSRMIYKTTYLKFRMKMLRRINQPEFFENIKMQSK